MRAVFIGASSLSMMTAKVLTKRGHEVVIIERDKERIDELKETLDCGFINGDGSKPAILKEADPIHTNVLFCLTDDDKANILAAQVGISLGFKRVVNKIIDPELEHVCIELGLEETIIPARTISRLLADKFEGRDPLELSTMIRDEARIFSFVLPDKFDGTVANLDLHDKARVVCVYREDKLIIPNGDSNLKSADEIVVVVHRDLLPALERRWGPEGSEKTN